MEKAIDSALHEKDSLIADLEARNAKAPSHESLSDLYREQGFDGRREIAVKSAVKGLELAGLLGDGNVLDLADKSKVKEISGNPFLTEGTRLGEKVSDGRNPEVQFKRVEKKGIGAAVMKRLGKTQYEDDVMVYVNLRNGPGGESDEVTSKQDTVVILQGKVGKDGKVSINDGCFSEMMSRQDFNKAANSPDGFNSKEAWIKGKLTREEYGNKWNTFFNKMGVWGDRFSKLNEGSSLNSQDRWQLEAERVRTVEVLNGTLTETLLTQKAERQKLFEAYSREQAEAARRASESANQLLALVEAIGDEDSARAELMKLLELSDLDTDQRAKVLAGYNGRHPARATTTPMPSGHGRGKKHKRR